MQSKSVVGAVAALAAAFALGTFYGRRQSNAGAQYNPTTSLWAYYRVLIDAAHDVESLAQGSAVPRSLHLRVEQARRSAAKAKQALPAESRWVVDIDSLPQPGAYESLDLAYQFVVLAEEIRSKLERRAADRREATDPP